MDGNHPKTVQTIMRHSSIALTMDTYGHLFPGQDADAVAKMPSLLSDPEPRSMRATGTSDDVGSKLHANRQQLGGKTCQNLASRGESPVSNVAGETAANVLRIAGLGEQSQDVAGSGESAPFWTRTKNLLIKSQTRTSKNTGENATSASRGTICGTTSGENPSQHAHELTAALARVARLRKALEQVADLAKGEARARALAALEADRLAFPGVPQNSGEADPTADRVEGGER